MVELKLGRLPNDKEANAVGELAEKMLRLGHGKPPEIVVAAVGTAMTAAFMTNIKAEFRLSAFDECVAFARERIKQGLG